MGFLEGIILAILLNVIANELYDQSSTLARWLMSYAVRRLRRADRSRYAEEWSAHLNECSGNIRQIIHACGFLRASAKLREGSRYVSSREKTARHRILALWYEIFKKSNPDTTLHLKRILRWQMRHELSELDESSLNEVVDMRLSRMRERAFRYIMIRSLVRNLRSI